MKHLAELKGTTCKSNGLKVEHAVEFEACGTFCAINKAQSFLRELGYTIGSMERNNPIGFADDEKYGYVSKWNNMNPTEHKLLDGVIISNDFREGGVKILFFNPPKF
jgi:hypothetical protein